LGDIGPVKIISEGSIGSNLRRIEAVTGTGPIERLRHEEALIDETAALLGVPPDEVVSGVQKRLAELKGLRDELKSLRSQASSGRAPELAATQIDGIVVARVDVDERDEMRDLVLAVRQLPGIRAVVLGGAVAAGGVALTSASNEDSINAAELIADAAKTVKGGGGKDAKLAVAGGKDASKIDEALDQVRAAAGLS
jgi:alanyl-tRNA synthetase